MGRELVGAQMLMDLAVLDSWLHRRDPRAMVLVVSGYAVAIMSLSPFQLNRTLWFAAFPLFFTVSAGLPMGLILRRAAWSLPFAVMLGIGMMVVDRTPGPVVSGLVISRGMVSAVTLIVRTFLVVWMALLLVSTASVGGLCAGARKLGAPLVLVEAVYFLVRYLGELGGRSARMQRAYRVRSGGASGMRPRVAGHAAMQLLGASVEKSRRVAAALDARGFSRFLDGDTKMVFRMTDGLTVAVSWLLFMLCRMVEIPLIARMIRGFA